jgi:hypothetical protein
LWSGSEDDLRGCEEEEFAEEVQRRQSRVDLVYCGLWKICRVSELFGQVWKSFQNVLKEVLDESTKRCDRAVLLTDRFVSRYSQIMQEPT